MAERSQIGYRQLLIGMILAIVFGILITFWAYLHVLYDMGAGSKARGWIVYMGWETFNRLQTWLVSPRETSVPELGVISGSFLFTVFLMIMKIRFLWWPLHPGGYVLVSGTGDGRFMVSHLSQLVGEGDCAEDRRRETLSASGAILFRIDFGRLYAWVRMEFDRTGAGDTDLHRVALMY